MGMSEFYGRADECESLRTIHTAINLGINFLDTADMYGRGANEELVGKAIRGKRDGLLIATKFGIVRQDGGKRRDGRPEYVRQACESSLRRLNIETIDLYYLHRLDPETPIEDTVGAMSDLVRQGKVRFLGLSKVEPEILLRAHAVHPIAALQMEYSLWAREVEREVLATCRKNDIALVAYSPLGKGFLGGGVQSLDGLAEDDWRRRDPRFQGDNLESNLQRLSALKKLAESKGCTTGQLSLAWILHQGEDIIALPGMRRVSRLYENIRAGSIALSREDLAAIDRVMPGFKSSEMRGSQKS
jgi:aryl-alcohol dehydrogenase-like predicted oxidoreductase